MPKVNVSKYIDIKAPLKTVAPFIRSFKSWHKWSPWFVLEPSATLAYGQDAKSYSWSGDIIGAGEMTLVDESLETGHEECEEYFYELKIKKPYKSQSRVRIELKTMGLYTRVTWELESGLPLFLAFMGKKLKTQIGMDYERGLKMLKDLGENGRALSKVTDIGEREVKEMEYLTLHGSCILENLGKTIEESFHKARELYDNPKVWTDTEPVVIYDKFDIENGLCVYRLGIPVKFKPDKDDYPGDYKYEKLEGFHAYMISHQGSYHHVGNAWALGMNLTYMKKVFKLHSERPMMEVYKNNPQEVENEADYLTYVLLPMQD